MKTIDVVGAVIRNEQNQILCALRSPTMSLPNRWEFPGGKMRAGETPEGALVREIEEELGCLIQVDNLVKDVEHFDPNIIIHLCTYEARIVEGTPRAKEHAELQWVSLHDLSSLQWAPADLPTVEKLVSERNR
ncbi:8-oxo-dGTP diphosphatase [Melghirimyces profundicolus]|uniref:8-oxo-dGTP diphosphatase n=1 Tax=Melghirimyces profundicolus TaxID=1242148 RepID=A0A2T6B159_9BACL|nr:(deoxy)nucleoside triphosphate pyrophosphohydrolase [Melghirimyces profundicolus]PTX49818.1 8-oxo-dGTP diphosphatase [Melghirimyces profundicolus]